MGVVRALLLGSLNCCLRCTSRLPWILLEYSS